MTRRLPIHFLHSVNQANCLIICALFLFPAFVVQPALASSSMAMPEEREESNKNDNADDESSVELLAQQIGRRAVSHRSQIARSTETNSTHTRQPAVFNNSTKPKDVYQNGLGARLRC